MSMITELKVRKHDRARHVESLANLQKKLQHEKTKLDEPTDNMSPGDVQKEMNQREENIRVVEEFVERQSKAHNEAIAAIDAELAAVKAAL